MSLNLRRQSCDSQTMKFGIALCLVVGMGCGNAASSSAVTVTPREETYTRPTDKPNETTTEEDEDPAEPFETDQ